MMWRVMSAGTIYSSVLLLGAIRKHLRRWMRYHAPKRLSSSPV
jgi:hypothetical protein